MSKYDKLLVTKNGEYEYAEDSDEEGYGYSIRFHVDGQILYNVIITRDMVLLGDYVDKKFLHTNMIPESLFGAKDFLTHEELEKIVDVLVKIGFDGKSFSKEGLASAILRGLL